MDEGNLLLECLPAGDVDHPTGTPCFLELREDTRYPQGLLRVEVGYALVLHHPGVIYIADSRMGDRIFLCNISVLHLAEAEKDESSKSDRSRSELSQTVPHVIHPVKPGGKVMYSVRNASVLRVVNDKDEDIRLVFRTA